VNTTEVQSKVQAPSRTEPGIQFEVQLAVSITELIWMGLNLFEPMDFCLQIFCFFGAFEAVLGVISADLVLCHNGQYFELSF
jgi:hypothetical protein